MLDSIRVKIEGRGIDVNEYRYSSRSHNRTGGGKKAEHGSDDCISRLHTGSDQRQPQRFGSRGAADRTRSSGLSRDFALERLDLRPKNEDLRVAYPRDGRQYLF